MFRLAFALVTSVYLSLQAYGACDKGEPTGDLTDYIFNYDGRDFSSIEHKEKDCRSSHRVTWQRRTAKDFKASNNIIYFPSKKSKHKDADYVFFTLHFHEDGKSSPYVRNLALNPLKLCIKDGVYEPWTFYRSHDFLSVVGEFVTLTGTPDLKNSTVCGHVLIVGEASIENTFLRGGDNPNDGIMYILENIGYSVTIAESELVGKILIGGNVFISYSKVVGDGSFVGGSGASRVVVYDTRISGKPYVKDNAYIIFSDIVGNPFISENVELSQSEIEGNPTITENVRIDHSRVVGDGQYSENGRILGSSKVEGENHFSGTYHITHMSNIVDSVISGTNIVVRESTIVDSEFTGESTAYQSLIQDAIISGTLYSNYDNLYFENSEVIGLGTEVHGFGQIRNSKIRNGSKLSLVYVHPQWSTRSTITNNIIDNSHIFGYLQSQDTQTITLINESLNGHYNCNSTSGCWSLGLHNTLYYPYSNSGSGSPFSRQYSE